MTQIIIQTKEGKNWEDRILARVIKMTVYVPRDTIDPRQIKKIHKTTFHHYITTEGYGK